MSDLGARVAAMEEKLDEVVTALGSIAALVEATHGDVQHVSKQTDRVAAHVPFVDGLARLLERMNVLRLFSRAASAPPEILNGETDSDEDEPIVFRSDGTEVSQGLR